MRKADIIESLKWDTCDDECPPDCKIDAAVRSEAIAEIERLRARLAEAERLLSHVDAECACARVDIDAVAAFLRPADSAAETRP